MTKTPLPAYADLEQALFKTALKLHPSQAHGIICGMLCGQAPKDADWEKVVTGGKETKDVHSLLQAVFDASNAQLNSFDFDFELLLPVDDEELMTRAEALTLWCQGFLTGLEQANVPVAHREPGDASEAIADLIEIAKMNFEEVISNEEDEVAYVELIEFVRMAVLLIFQEMRDKADDNTTTSNTHLH